MALHHYKDRRFARPGGAQVPSASGPNRVTTGASRGTHGDTLQRCISQLSVSFKVTPANPPPWGWWDRLHIHSSATFNQTSTTHMETITSNSESLLYAWRLNPVVFIDPDDPSTYMVTYQTDQLVQSHGQRKGNPAAAGGPFVVAGFEFTDDNNTFAPGVGYSIDYQAVLHLTCFWGSTIPVT